MAETEGNPQEGHENKKIFKPTPQMIYYWNAFADPYTKPNISDTAVKAVEMMQLDGVPKIPTAETLRREVYKWENREGYKEWSIAYWDKLMGESKPLLDKIGLRRGVKDFRYWEAMQMKYANYKRRSDLTTDNKPINDTTQIANLLTKVLEDDDETTGGENKGTGSNNKTSTKEG